MLLESHHLPVEIIRLNKEQHILLTEGKEVIILFIFIKVFKSFQNIVSLSMKPYITLG